jgi:hypothetical protein
LAHNFINKKGNLMSTKFVRMTFSVILTAFVMAGCAIFGESIPPEKLGDYALIVSGINDGGSTAYISVINGKTMFPARPSTNVLPGQYTFQVGLGCSNTATCRSSQPISVEVKGGYRYRLTLNGVYVSDRKLPIGSAAETRYGQAEEEQRRKAEAEALLLARQRQAELERTQLVQQREQTIRDLPRIKTGGEKICKTIDGTHRDILGYGMGKPMYGPERHVKYHISAFTENVSGSKIQVRISGIQLNGENVDRVDGDTVLQNGSIIWDEALEWSLCR